MNESTYLRLSNQKEAPVGWIRAFRDKDLNEIQNSIIKGIKEQKKDFSIEKVNQAVETIKSLSMIRLKNTKQDYYYHKCLKMDNTEGKKIMDEKVYALLGPVNHFSVNRIKSDFNIPIEVIDKTWEDIEKTQKAIKDIVKIHRNLYRTCKDTYEDLNGKVKVNFEYNYDTKEYVQGNLLDEVLKNVNEICSIKRKIKNKTCEIISINPLEDIIKTDAYNIYGVRDNGREGYIDHQLNLTSLSKAKMFKSEKEAQQTVIKMRMYLKSVYILKQEIKLNKVVHESSSNKLNENNLTRALKIKQKNELESELKNDTKSNNQIKIKKKIM